MPVLSRFTFYSILSRFLGVILIFAGTTKSLTGEALLPVYGVPVLEIAEALFGFWVFFGFTPQFCWWLLSASFITFFGIALEKSIVGEAQCGCFGKFSIAPIYMVIFDGLAVALLAIVNPQMPFILLPNLNLKLLSYTLVAALYTVLVLVGIFRESLLGRVTIEPGEGLNISKLSPNDWVGRPFPLIERIESGAKIARGKWLVMFYHGNCSRCSEAIPRFVGRAHQLSNGTSGIKFALIELPPYGPGAENGRQDNLTFMRSRLSEGERLSFSPPYFFFIDNQTVIFATNSFSALLSQLKIIPDKKEYDDGFVFPNFRQHRRDEFLKEIACGPLALIAILNDFGRRISPEDIDKLIAEAGNEGIDMLRLKRLAEARGLYALGAVMSPEVLKKTGQKAIIRSNKVGFAAVTGFVPDGFVVASPLRSPGIIPNDIFAKSFGSKGPVLLLSETPLTPEQFGLEKPDTANKRSGPNLVLSRSLVSVGRIHRSKWKASLSISNDGTDALEIKSLKPSCPCFSAKVEKNHLLPNESTVLHLDGEVKLYGGFTYELAIETNQKNGPRVEVPVRGFVEQPVGFAKPAVTLLGVSVGKAFEAEVELDIPSNIDAERLKILTVGPEGLEVQIQIRKTKERFLTLRSSGVKQPGLQTWQINIYADNDEKIIRSVFYLTCDILPGIDLLPKSASLSDKEFNSEWNRIIHCSCPGLPGEKLKVYWDDATFAGLTNISLNQQNNSGRIKAIINITPTRTWKDRTYKGRRTLIVESPSGERAPAYFYFGDNAFNDFSTPAIGAKK